MACAVDPYSLTATGVLGDKRDTMLHNPLILRVIGKTRQFHEFDNSM